MADTEVFLHSFMEVPKMTENACNFTQYQHMENVTTAYDNQEHLICNSSKRFAAPPYEYDEKVKYITIVAYMITFIFGLIGNSLVIYVIWHYHKIRVKSVANYYIWNLALADELFILALPLFCWATFTRHWPIPGIMGTISCKLAYVIRDINKFSSIFLLVALSVDRCLASFPALRAFRTNTVGKWACLLIWITCALIATPYLLYAQTMSTHHGTSCRLAWPQRPVQNGFPYLRFWTQFQLIVGLILPATMILTSYILLYVRLKRLQAKHENSSVKRPSKKMTQTILVVVVTFVLCQTPYHVLQFIAQGKVEKVQEFSARGEMYYPPQSEVTTFVYLNLVSQFLVFVSSCCNPIIYGLLNENYRRLYCAALCQCRDDVTTDGDNTSRMKRRDTAFFDLDTDLSRPSPVQIRFEIKFHLPCDSYYWRRFWKWRKRDSTERCIEMDRVTEVACINGREELLEWQNSLPGTSEVTTPT